MSCQSGSGYTIASSLRSSVVGKSFQANVIFTVTTIGTCGASITVPMPFTVAAGTVGICENGQTTYAGTAQIVGSTLYVQKYDGTNLAAANGQTLSCHVSGETN